MFDHSEMFGIPTELFITSCNFFYSLDLPVIKWLITVTTTDVSVVQTYCNSRHRAHHILAECLATTSHIG